MRARERLTLSGCIHQCHEVSTDKDSRAAVADGAPLLDLCGVESSTRYHNPIGSQAQHT
jgi:hypothetical protein